MKRLFFTMMLSVIIFLSGCDQDMANMGGRGTLSGGDVQKLQQRALEIVRDGLQDKNGLIRANAIEVVANTKREELMPRVTKLLWDDLFAVRFTAAAAIGDIGYLPGKYPLIRLLMDKNENVRIAASYALVKLGAKNSVTIIRRSIRSKNQTIRANASLLLGKLGNQDDLELLYWALNDAESGDMVKLQTVEAIAMLGDETIYQKRLWPLLISKYADERVMGIRGMGALKTKEGTNAVKTMLYDEVPEVRLVAAEQLGRLGDISGEPEVLEYFMKIAKEIKKMDRIAAGRANVLGAMAIGRIGTERLRRFLPGLIKSQAKEVQLSAAQAVLLLTQ